MGSLNKVILMGNLTRDGELRFIPSGQPVLEFRLAVNRRFKMQSGEDREEVLFIDVQLWGKRAEALAQYMKKGKSILVEGRLKLDEWEKDGQKHSKIRVVAENIEFTGGGRGGDGGSEPRDMAPPAEYEGPQDGSQRYSGYDKAPQRRPAPAPAPAVATASAAAQPQRAAIADEEIPF